MKFTLKTFILLVLVVCMVLPTLLLCSCNGDTGTDETTTESDNTTATPEAEQTTGATTSATTAGDDGKLKIVSGETTEYRIIYGRDADVYAGISAEYIAKRIGEATGTVPRVATDERESGDY